MPDHRNMKWPAHNLKKARAADRRKLAEWLAERELDGLLNDAGGTTTGSEPPADAGASNDLYVRDTVRAGDIRLLMPRSGLGAIDSPVYVAALPGGVAEEVVAVPFGRYAVPALPTEWKTGMKQAALRVLCFWNAHRVAVDRFPPSWRVKRLTARQVTAWTEVRCQVEQGSELPGGVQNRIGPPLLHPADPRHAYVAEEQERVNPYFTAGKVNALTTSEEEGLYLTEWRSDPVDWLMAAEGREKYGVAAFIYATEDEAVVVAVYEEETDRVRVRIMNRDGFPCHRFDGGHVESIAGGRSAPIRSGLTTAPTRMVSSLEYIVDRSGQRVRLQRRYRETPNS